MADEEKKLIDPIVPYREEQPKENVVNNKKDLIQPITFGVRTKSVEEKIYIIFYKLNECEDEDMSNIFSICIGRTETYSDIKNKLESGMAIDVHRSRVMTETKQTDSNSGEERYFMIDYEDCISLYSFCKKSEYLYEDMNFSIEDYNDGNVPETDELASHPGYLTKEQQQYRDMLMDAISRERHEKEMHSMIYGDSKPEETNV